VPVNRATLIQTRSNPIMQPKPQPHPNHNPPAAICLYHKDATWTYEVCHRNRVRQFRQVGRKSAGGGKFTVAGGGACTTPAS
jgi:hypothetical protein